MKKSRRTYNGVHLNKKSNTQDVVEQSLTIKLFLSIYYYVMYFTNNVHLKFGKRTI